MKKIRKAEAHSFTLKTAATAADTTPEVMAECLQKIGLRPDECGEINLSLLFYAVRFSLDPNRPKLTPDPVAEARKERAIVAAWCGGANP